MSITALSHPRWFWVGQNSLVHIWGKKGVKTSLWFYIRLSLDQKGGLSLSLFVVVIFDGDRWSIFICLPDVLLCLSRCYLGTIIGLWQIRCVLYFFFLHLFMIMCEHTFDKTQTMYIVHAFEKWIFISSWRNILLINWEDVGNTSLNSTLWKIVSASLVSLKMLRSFIWDFVNYTTIPPGPKMDFPSFLSAARDNSADLELHRRHFTIFCSQSTKSIIAQKYNWNKTATWM